MSQAFSVMFENERENCCVDKYDIGNKLTRRVIMMNRN